MRSGDSGRIPNKEINAFEAYIGYLCGYTDEDLNMKYEI